VIVEHLVFLWQILLSDVMILVSVRSCSGSEGLELQ